MNIEYEIRVLEIDVEQITRQIKEIGATFEKEMNYQRYVYDMIPEKEDEWLRLRTDGKEITLTYKKITNEENIEGTEELEIEVDDFNKTNELLRVMGYKYNNYQENKRIRYRYKNVEIDIDSWPLIPPYLEIEGPSEQEVIEVLDLLNISKEKTTFLNCGSIYQQVYNIDYTKIKELKFETN